jgi:IS30 family transposase
VLRAQPGETDMSVSHETIYTWIYAQPKGELARAGIILRTSREQRKPRGRKKSTGAKITGMRSIEERSAEAARRPHRRRGPSRLFRPCPFPVGARHQREHQRPDPGILPERDRDNRRHGLLWSVADSLNDRPRAILGFRKPSEVFAELLLQEAVIPPA